MKRKLEFDGIRCIAIIMIVICHLCYGIQNYSIVGQYLGGCFNCVFFLISAMLIGSKPLPKNFMSKRIFKIGIPLWIFLVITFIIYIALDINFSMFSFILNILMLGWISKLPGLGHLWFVTMIVACYFLFWSINKFTKIRKSIKFFLLCIISLTIQFTLERLHLPSYIGLVLLYSGIVYLYSHFITNWISTVNFKILLICTFIINAYCIIGLYLKHFQIGELLYYYITTICGITVFIILYKFFKKYKPNHILLFISSISYELYLTHHPLCFVQYFTQISHSIILAIFIIITLSISSAYMLNRITTHIFMKLK